ncbi:MAG: hypothetical protein BHV96_03755 [Clostridium sp. CAG:354_28_25]|nr:MAG: hypothetical protein BHV96_03755 [Clostridium sp. CAG:354_28_25]
MLKNIIKTLSIIFLVALVIISFSGCSKQKTDEEQLRDKNISEIDYLDNYIMLMLNSINNIDLKQYDAKIEKTENLNEILQESEETSSEDTGNNVVQYRMVPNTILNANKTINWENLKLEIENLNNTWPSIIVDLYKANVDNKKLTEFSDLINTCIGNIKNENRTETLNSLAKLYEYIPVFLEKIASDNKQIELAKTKVEVIKAYVNIDFANWEELKTSLDRAISNFEPIVNNTNEAEKEYNIRKAYVLLQEFKNAVDTNDKDLLFMKYKNLMEELIIL